MFDLTYPIISAPMSNHSGGMLAGAVSAGGGLGMFGGINPKGAAWVREQIALTRSKTDRPFGIGYITQQLEDNIPAFEAAMEERVPAVLFSFADPRRWARMVKDSGAKVVCQVQTVADAETALDAGVDILVAQGNEAGGHSGVANLLPLLVELLDRFPGTPVVAAGGIAGGRALAAVLAAGAAGAMIGTAFLATPEAVEVPDEYKQRIIASDGTDTVYTRVFDIVHKTKWPEHIGARVLRNDFARLWHGKEPELRSRLEEIRPEYMRERERHNSNVAAVYMGLSAASVKSVRPAAQVLSDISTDAERLLGRSYDKPE